MDLRVDNEETHLLLKEIERTEQLCFRVNQTMPRTKESEALIRELFCGRIGEGTLIHPPIHCMFGNRVEIGSDCVLMYNAVLMSAGGIKIGDHVRIAANAQILSNNHDPIDKAIIVGKPVLIEDNVWIGAGVSILPGVTVGEGAIIGAGSIVTKNVEPYSVVVGNPARMIRRIEH